MERSRNEKTEMRKRLSKMFRRNKRSNKIPLPKKKIDGLG